jgi:hypothetical protein
MTLARVGLLVVALALAASGCGGSSDEASDTTSESPSVACETLPKPAADFLESALYGKQLVGPVMVPSEVGFGAVYLVAGRVDGQPALWAMDKLDGGGLIFSVNDHAYDVSEMGRSEDLREGLRFDESVDGGAEALACVS